MSEQTSYPIPVRCMEPWLEDNADFLTGIAERSRLLETAHELRDELDICTFTPCEPCPLAAVDAAVADASIGDLLSILMQSVHIDPLGQTTLGQPQRLTGADSQELSLAKTPLRLALECTLLADSQDITIADTSYWSMLMEANKTITSYRNGGAQQHGIARAYDTLITRGMFLGMLRNIQVIAMSKRSQAGQLRAKPSTLDRFKGFVSDRELYGRLLHPGEFLVPQTLIEGTAGNFGVEKNVWKDSESAEIRFIYTYDLGVTYFKPHAWSRAFRIEARLACLQDEAWLMPLLSAVAVHTLTRTVEPFPQFMADYTTKQIAGVTQLYGELNFHRTPFFDPSRTDFH